MRAQKSKRIAVGIIAFLMALTCLFGVMSFSPVAYAASSPAPDASFRGVYKTTDRKPTYTATLNENNKLLKKLEGKLDGQSGKKENKALSFTKKYGKDIIDETFSALVLLKKSSSGKETDWEQFGVDLVKNLIVAVAACYGFGGIADSVFNGLEALLANGEAPLSEIEILTDNMDRQFDRMSDQLYDIEEQISALSNDVQKATAEILSGTSSQIENLDAKQVLRAFMTSGEGNFSYTQFQNYIYGSTRGANADKATAYYNQLIEAIVFGADDATIQYYYNKLFDALSSDITIFRQYYFGNVAGLDKSVAKYYYDYLSANPSLIPSGKTAESMSIEFAYDLYSTYVYAYELIKLCYSYQLTEMYIEESLNGCELGVNSKYKYNATDYSYYTVIMNDLNDIETYITQAEEAVVNDVAYILGMGNSYIVADSNGNLHDIAKYGNTFGNIADEQIIYLNKISDSINDIFELDSNKYSYYVNGVKNDDVQTQGIIDTDSVSDSFNVSVQYGSKELYSIAFSKNVTNAFSGGSGSYDDPYLISNEYQFMKIGDEMDACYELIDDLRFGGIEVYPIGTYEKPFNGILNGNGYTISNLRINSLPYDKTNIKLVPTTGLFGTIGNVGIIENLNIEGIRVVSDYNKDGIIPEENTTTYYIGTIAGYNNGKIFNCTVANSAITVYRDKVGADSRTVEVYVGGIVGTNNNTISYCSIDSINIDAKSMLQLHAEPAKTNKNSLFVAGITATTTGTVSYCRVSSETILSAYAKSTANTEDKVKPYVTVKTGGIVANENDYTRLTSVYSNANTINCRGEVYNDGNHWLLGHRYAYDNVAIKSGAYYPTYFWISVGDTLDVVENAIYESKYNEYLNKAIQDYNREHGMLSYSYYNLPVSVQNVLSAKAQKETKQYLISEKEKAEVAAVTKLDGRIASNNDELFTATNTEYEVEITDNSVYEINTQTLNQESLTFNINGVIAKDVRIVNYYGFNTYNELTNTVTNNVKIFFVVDIDEESILLSGDVVITVREDRIIGDPVISGIKTEYEINSNKEVGLSEMFEQGFTISYYHANGKVDSYYINSSNINAVKIYDFDISICNDEGFTFTILHNGNPIEQVAKVNCYHRSVSHAHDVPATCQALGYEVWICNDCGKEIQKNYMAGDHHYVVEDGTAATCMEPGHTQCVKCDVCGIVFEESEWIQVLEHDYISIATAKARNIKVDSSYLEGSYHYCVNGNHYEPHQYVATESTDEAGKMIYIYTCLECGHSYFEVDDNLITTEQGKMPTVFVTDGYVLNVGDEVTVYVQLLNNPGFNGANFGIRYSDGLELISAEEGTIIPNALSVSNEVYKGYNYLWAKKDKENWTEDGYILKLIFKVTSETRTDQTVEVVYGYQKITYTNGKIDEAEGGFATTSAKYGVQKFITYSGTISFVNHLPGDVNEDNEVDIMDAMYIAWGIVGKQGVSFKKQNADVNLDGKVDLYDVIWILQSISGNYGTNLLNPEYKLQLNLNGFDTDAFDKFLTVYFYDGNGEVNNWNTNISFSEYEAEMNRRGYTFIGWYNRLVGGEQIDTSKQIVYDANLGTQTLYAHWAKNSLSFDMSGATSAQISNIEYQPNEYIIELSTPELEYDVDYYVSDNHYQYGIIYKTFEGWYLNGEKVTQVDLSTANIGDLVLEARWSATYTWNMPTESRKGYENITKWYWNVSCNENYYIGENLSDSIVSKLTTAQNGKLLIFGVPKLTSYYIDYEMNPSNYCNSEALNNPTSPGNTTSFNIETKDIYIATTGVSGHNTKAYILKGWCYNKDLTGEVITGISASSLVNKIADGEDTIILYAKWEALPINVIIKGIDETSWNSNSGTYKETKELTGSLYYCYGDKEHESGYYSVSSLISTRKIEKLSYDNTTFKYDNFEVKGCYGLNGLSTITNNGHSSNNGSQSVSFAANTAYFDASGNPTSLKPTTDTTIYAYCCPKLYTITFNLNAPVYGTTSSDGYTASISVNFNENMPDSISMPQNTYFRCKYIYNGLNIYNDNGVILDDYKTAWFLVSDITSMVGVWDKQVYQNEKYIKNEYDLKNLDCGAGKINRLISDIEISGSWMPISYFAGELNGDGHSIKGLYYSGTFTAKNNEYCFGLFAKIEGTTNQEAIVRDIKIENIYVNGEYYSGSKGSDYYSIAGIAGYAKNVIFTNCSVSGDIVAGTKVSVSGWLYCGGLVGHAYNCKFTYCKNATNLSGRIIDLCCLGGIIGYIDNGDLNSHNIIKYCYNTGNMSATGENQLWAGFWASAGGIVGAASIGNSHYVVEIIGCYNYCNSITATNGNYNFKGCIIGRSQSANNANTIYDNYYLDIGLGATESTNNPKIGKSTKLSKEQFKNNWSDYFKPYNGNVSGDSQYCWKKVASMSYPVLYWETDYYMY